MLVIGGLVISKRVENDLPIHPTYFEGIFDTDDDFRVWKHNLALPADMSCGIIGTEALVR